MHETPALFHQPHRLEGRIERAFNALWRNADRRPHPEAEESASRGVAAVVMAGLVPASYASALPANAGDVLGTVLNSVGHRQS